MKGRLGRLLQHGRCVRALGFDDAPFPKRRGAKVRVAGVVCARTRFEGMLWGHVRRDGWNATDSLIALVSGSKFLPQLHLVLLDGIALGGFNVVDLRRLAEELGLPCVAVMRRLPDRDAVRHAIGRLPRAERRREIVDRAGPIHSFGPFHFHAHGDSPEVVAAALSEITDRGHVPECLRLAHLIGSAVMTGQSSNRA